VALAIRGLHPLFAGEVSGVDLRTLVPEARLFLRDLTEHATQRRYVYRHRWRVGLAYDDARYRRELRRVTTLDIAR
jgi:hypothetical protein